MTPLDPNGPTHIDEEGCKGRPCPCGCGCFCSEYQLEQTSSADSGNQGMLLKAVVQTWPD